MVNPTTNIDDLRALLEQLYPDIHISGSGVALLAAEIAELDDRCELLQNRVDYQPGPRQTGGPSRTGGLSADIRHRRFVVAHDSLFR
jgi:hypothetical protein